MRLRFLRSLQVAIDLAVLTLSFVAAFLIRFDGDIPSAMVGRLFLTGPYVVGFEYGVLVALGVHRFAWRYVGLREASRILMAALVAFSALLVLRVASEWLLPDVEPLKYGLIPLGVLVVNFALGYLGVAGVRVVRRLLGERAEADRRRVSGKPAVRTVLVGAGQEGVLVAREIAQRPDLGLFAVGFLDDDPAKIGTTIHGLSVMGDTASIRDICGRVRAGQVLITMSNAPGSAIRRIKKLSEDANIKVKIVPGLGDIVGGRVNLSQMRDVNIEDVLRREPVALDMASISADVEGRTVMVTGAGGSIGSELCRQLCRFAPRRLLLVERAENSLFHIHREIAQTFPMLDIVPCIADVLDSARMQELFAEHRPALVLHAAAHKHVPMMEWNPAEAIKNNVLGTRNVADLAIRYGVSVFVMISTDKAVNPTSVMGATKRAAELYIQGLSQTACDTRFVTVRFGNVLGSAGSVIPIFQEQIARGGPVTVTHPEMRRYFMTIPEACQLVLQAGAMGRGGEIFILDMGEPVKIVDLARDLIALSGLRPDEDIDIVFSGARPGEKLFEELSTRAEHADRTRHPKIFVGRIESAPWNAVLGQLERIETALDRRSPGLAVHALSQMVPTYTGQGSKSQAASFDGPDSDREPSALVREALVH